MTKRSRRRSPRIPGEPIMPPTAEQMRGDRYAMQDITEKGRDGVAILIGKAWRRVRMIDRLRDRKLITPHEHEALAAYQRKADVLDRSLTRDSLADRVGPGSGDGPTMALIEAGELVHRCEAAAGSLVDLLRAVVVHDRSLTEIAIERGGGVEAYHHRNGKRVGQIRPRRSVLGIVTLEMRVLAKRVAAEMDA